MNGGATDRVTIRGLRSDEVRVRVEKPHPEGLDAESEAVELTIARAVS